MKRLDQRIASSAWALLPVALACCSGVAHAETPLSLAVSETLTYDSNVLRDDRFKRRDLVSTTGVRLGVEKDYGRQNYRASVQGILQRYKNSKEYDNDGFEAELAFSTELGRRWFIGAEHTRSRSLQDLGQQGTTRQRELIDSAYTVVNVRYGLGGWWSLTGSFSSDEQTYDFNTTQDRESRGLRLGVRYNFTDLKYIDVGVRRSSSEFPRLIVIDSSGTAATNSNFGRLTIGEDIRRTDLDVQGGWTITGYSALTGRVSYADERHEPDLLRSYKGLTWRVNWRYSPSGKMTYTLALDRDTNDSGGNATTVRTTTGTTLGSRAQDRLSTTITASARWLMTSKTSSSLQLTHRRIQESSSLTSRGGTTDSAESQDGRYVALNLGLRWAPTRTLAFDCSLGTYERSESLFSLGYSGETAACTAALTFD